MGLSQPGDFDANRLSEAALMGLGLGIFGAALVFAAARKERPGSRPYTTPSVSDHAPPAA